METPEPVTKTTGNSKSLDPNYIRGLARMYLTVGQLTSAFFWADALVATNEPDANGDDVWLLATIMLARDEPHRAAHTIVSRELHRTNLVCLSVAMRAYLAAKEPATALSLLEECDSSLLEPGSNWNHNRALSTVLIQQARALSALERREAAAEALASALRADAGCYEALDLLLEQHFFTVRQEMELLEYVLVEDMLPEAEQILVRKAYRERLQRYSPLPSVNNKQIDTDEDNELPLTQTVEEIRKKTHEGRCCLARRQIASCHWKAALDSLDSVDPWSCPELRATCLLELRKSSELFVFAHRMVDAYPNSWTAWFAVGLYYFLIGKSEFARRYLTKAKSLEPSAGCVWLAYGHSFAKDNEHDQAIAAYMKASQLMPGCYLPPMYVGVECSLLNNIAMAQRFLLRAAMLHSAAEAGEACEEEENVGSNGESGGWEVLARTTIAGECAHEAACAALAARQYRAASQLARQALPDTDDALLHPRWAATLDTLGHALRKLGQVSEALECHQKALTLRPKRATTYTCIGLCQAMLGREREAADTLHSALAVEPDEPVAAALLDTIIDKLDNGLNDEEIPQFPFPEVQLTPPAPPPAPTHTHTHTHTHEQTNTSDMSMSFD